MKLKKTNKKAVSLIMTAGMLLNAIAFPITTVFANTNENQNEPDQNEQQVHVAKMSFTINEKYLQM